MNQIESQSKMTALASIGLTPDQIRAMTHRKPQPAVQRSDLGRRIKHPPEKVEAMRRDREAGMTMLQIAVKHGVSSAYVWGLFSGRYRKTPESEQARHERISRRNSLCSYKSYPPTLVKAIRRMHANGARNIDICRKYKLQEAYVSRILAGHIRREDAK